MSEPPKKEENEISEEKVLTDEDEIPERTSNLYAAKKSVAQGMMDVALITANANQLRFVMEYNQGTTLFFLVITLITVSLILQLIVGACLIFKGRMDLRGKDKFQHANRLNNYIVSAVFMITVINVFIAAFSINPPPAPPPAPLTRNDRV